MIPSRHKPPQDHVDSWLMSYADMITLLLCFFVIFVSVSEPRRDKMEEITHGMANKFGGVDLSAPLQSLYRSLQEVIEKRQLLKDVAINQSQLGVVMELSADTFFTKGSAELSEDQLDTLEQLAAIIKNADVIDYRIKVESYTSDVPANPAMYPSNWEFTASRAARMVRFLTDQGINSEHVSATGFGDTRAEVPNLDSQGKPIPENRKKNERIVVKIERVL